MMAVLLPIAFWHWFILAAVLVILEILAPGVIFLWLGIAAAATGFAVLAVADMAWEHQTLVFCALSVVSVVVGRVWWARKGDSVTDHPNLNRRGEQVVGRVLELSEPIVAGTGKARVGDASWKVSGGDDLPAGTRVRVVGVEGATLKVERAPD